MEAIVEGAAGEAFVVYSHIGVSSVVSSEGAAEGTLQLRDDLRGPAGVLAAPLIVMVLDSAATATLSLASAIPTQVGVELFDAASDVTALSICGQVRRLGRSQIFYDARIKDAAHPSRLVAYGSVNMSVTGSPIADYIGHSSGGSQRRESDRRPLTEVFEGRPRSDGSYEIATLTSRTGFGRLHAGVMTVMAEAAATKAVTAVVGARLVRTEQLDAQLLNGGKVGPFPVIPEVLAIDGHHATCRIEILDRGADSRLVSVIVGRFRIVDGDES